jgi:tetratricopeptide (TPR) repeat protein
VAARLPAAAPTLPDALRRALQPLLDLARGGHLTHPPDPRDVLLLRALAVATPEAAARAELHAAEARLLVGFGQPEAAGARLAGTIGGGFAGEALLALARAELAFAVGDVDAAWSNALAAAEAQGAAGDAAGRAVTWRRVAERLAERGEIERADEAWRRARQASRLLRDDGGLAAAMRGAAALALSRGEWVGASALHEEAAETVAPAAERANLRLSELTLALVRGENARLRRGLDALEEAATDDALLAANLARRRADAALRQGDQEGAREAADRAADLHARDDGFRSVTRVPGRCGASDCDEHGDRRL